MNRRILRAKIHRVLITDSRLDYDGSLGIAEELMNAADIVAGEEVLVANIATGARFVTYAITAPSGSGVILNGAAARLGEIGDTVIVMCFGTVPEEEARNVVPSVVLMEDDGVTIRH